MSETLPKGWIKKESGSRPGKFYYYNTKSKESTWSKPSNEEVKASHLLVKHMGSRNPTSWKDKEGTLIKQRSKEEAIKILQGYRKQIENKEYSFESLASVHSDCSSAKRGGDLGSFGRGQMQKPFEEATYALKVGEMSGIVDTDSGVHIILRTG
eukprot:gb/GEZN01012865.1/.p1 GENE.gb/GEZN01012865.1/~~gb/GEZN01012865.1/.p1  ORF type:complete len:154 (+),score=26.50 gb/GEZN01012865.1/:52-513(+)